jgi:uncharacterized protein (DUF2267 family)
VTVHAHSAFDDRSARKLTRSRDDPLSMLLQDWSLNYLIRRGAARMSTTGYQAFDTTIQKTNLVLRDIEQIYGWPPVRRQQSYAAVRAVLHALRDRLPIAEAADLGAQLPMLLRGLYYEGWEPARVPVKMGRQEFLDAVRDQFRFEVTGGMATLVTNVFQVLSRYISDGERADVAATLPDDLASLISA